MEDSISGEVKLFRVVKGMPEGGLNTKKLRVELVEKSNPKSAWIAEINILGKLPWFEGEKRKVEIRIMTDEFKVYVETKHPSLFVRYGSQIIGQLEL